MMLPAISSKLYQKIVSEMVSLRVGPERTRVAVLQRQLSEAQQDLAREKKLDLWLKAG